MGRVRRSEWIGCAVLVAVLCTLGRAEASSETRTVRVRAVTANFAALRPDGSTWDSGLTPSPDIDAKVMIDGRRAGKCDKVWLEDKVRCELDVPLAIDADTRIELIVDDKDFASSERMGTAVYAAGADPVPKRGRAKLAMKAEGSVSNAAVIADVVWEPWMPKRNARVLAVLVGVLIASVAFAALRKRFLTRGGAPALVEAPSALGSAVNRSVRARDRSDYRRSVAFMSSAGATALAWVLIVTLRGELEMLEPVLAAIPMTLGAYAVTSTLIDAFGTSSFGRKRIYLLLFAAVAIAAVPAAAGLDGLDAFSAIYGYFIVGILFVSLLL